jgi:curved DNA-binding protein
MKYKDYYATLGVPQGATLDQIKKAYRKLARQHHPDLSKAPGAEARFKEAAEAYATLKDTDKRAAYDELGRRPPGEEFAPPPQWRQAHSTDGQAFDEMDLADLLAALNRQHGAAQKLMPRAGRDFETTAHISLDEAHRGTVLGLQLDDGAGGLMLEVTVPPGVSEGQKLRLRGKGGKGSHGGIDGDIYLHIHLRPHAVFRVDKHDLYFDLTLAPWEAVLGGDIEVPTPDGPVLLTVPAGTRSGRRLKMRGRGLSRGKGHPTGGDLYAVVHIDVPATLSEREREIFQELSKISRFKPRELPKQGE